MTTLAHISEQPWSNYTAADYTPEQWHRACLIHQHDGPPTSKNQCKLPVRTPQGTLSRAGCHAAAGALAGARGGVDATSEEKAKAAAALRGLYKQLDEKPPESLTHSLADLPLSSLAHFGVKGMKWGVRRTPAQLDSASSDVVEVTAAKAKISSNRGSTAPLSNKELQSVVTRMNLEQQYSRLTTTPSTAAKIKKGAKAVGGAATGALAIGVTVNRAMQFAASPAGRVLSSAIATKGPGGQRVSKIMDKAAARVEKK